MAPTQTSKQQNRTLSRLAFFFFFRGSFPPCCSRGPSAWRVKRHTGGREKCSGAHALCASRRLLGGVACQRASARNSCRGGSGPPALLSMARREFKEGRSEGSLCRSRQNAAPPQDPRSSRCCTEGCRDGSRTGASEQSDKCRGRPPTSTPKTARRQRRAWPSSGYVWRVLRGAAWAKATPGRDSANGSGARMQLDLVLLEILVVLFLGVVCLVIEDCEISRFGMRLGGYRCYTFPGKKQRVCMLFSFGSRLILAWVVRVFVCTCEPHHHVFCRIAVYLA